MPKISALPAAASVAGVDLAPIVQGGVTKKATYSLVLAYIQANISISDSNFTGQLSLAHGGTNANLTAANGAIPYSTASAIALLPAGAIGQLLQSNGAAAPSWTTSSFPVVGGPSGNILISNGTNYIASTSLWPNTVGAAGKILRSDGTTNAYSTSTFADTYLINTLLYNASANTVSGLATANNGALITSAGGVPSISSTLPSAVQTNITALGTQAQALNMGTHLINNVVDPVSAQDAATKNYVDQTALNGTSVYAASAGSLGTVTQSGAGPGATLTNAGAQATFALDGVNPPVGSNVLIKDTATGMSAANEGIYTVSDVGSGATNWVLTRATSYDTATEINNTGLIVIQNGSTLVGTAWYNAATIVTVDTTNFSYSEFGNITFPISLAHGGTNANLTASNGGIFYSSATAGAILSGTATAGLALLSGSSTTPSWSSSPPITRINPVIITATGSSTYTPTAGTQYLIVELVGGGGAGGSGASGGAGTSGIAGGGGGAGYCRKTYTIASLGANATVVIGVGGTAGAAGNNPGGDGADSTFTPAGAGAILTASKGSGGGGTNSFASTGNSSAPGAGGIGTNGDLNLSGGYGNYGMTISGVGGLIVGGNGGSSFFSNMQQTHSIAASADGIAGLNYGGGGSGAFPAASNQAGGAGAQGVCYITEFISV